MANISEKATTDEMAIKAQTLTRNDRIEFQLHQRRDIDIHILPVPIELEEQTTSIELQHRFYHILSNETFLGSRAAILD